MQPLDPGKQRSPKVHVPTLNHVGVWIDDLAACVDGRRNTIFTPGGIRKGAAGHDVCFIHPKATTTRPAAGEGVLIELVQALPDVIAALGLMEPPPIRPPRPLAGLTVIELGVWVAGPAAGGMMAMGATSSRSSWLPAIRNAGCSGRLRRVHAGPAVRGRQPGKRSVVLDLRDFDDHVVFDRLLFDR